MSPAAAKPAPPNYARALVAFAERLYGDQWQRDLSRALGVHFNTTYRIARAAREGQDYATAQQLLADLHAHLVAVVEEMGPWVK